MLYKNWGQRHRISPNCLDWKISLRLSRVYAQEVSAISRIGIICDFRPASGFGHLSRTRLVATALENRKCSCVFLFQDTHKDYVEAYTHGLAVTYVASSDAEAFISAARKSGITAVIVDDYTRDAAFEAALRGAGLFVAAIDDHDIAHAASIVFSNRRNARKRATDTETVWLAGGEYTLVAPLPADAVKASGTGKPCTVLLHAGGASVFDKMIPFVEAALRASVRHHLSIDAICSSEEAKTLVSNLAARLDCTEHLAVLPLISDLRKHLGGYDIVAGTAGTTTFETIMAGSLSITAPFTEDGRDAPDTWLALGHMMHLTYQESRDPRQLDLAWDVTLAKADALRAMTAAHAWKLDGNGPARVADAVLVGGASSSLSDTVVEPPAVQSELCGPEMARMFMAARNQDFVRATTSQPDHVIVWPEHVGWWLKENIKRFALSINGIVSAFHWCAIQNDDDGQYVISGWFPVANSQHNLRLASFALTEQVSYVKKFFPGAIWVIAMKSDNTVAIALNKRVGFEAASELSTARARRVFKFEGDAFQVMEMQL